MTTRSGGLPVLNYHAFGPGRSVTNTEPARFAETVARLQDAGLRPIALDDWLAAGRPDAPGRYAVSIDDGLRSVLNVADLLERDAIPATLFVVADRVGRDNAWPGQPAGVPVEPTLTWSELAELVRRGLRVGAHGLSHARLGALDGPAVASELFGSRDRIEDRLGVPCRLLAYPYGESTAAVRRAASRGFAAAFGTRLDLARAGQDAFDLARVDAFYLRSQRLLDALADGAAHAPLRWRRALRAGRARFASVPAVGRAGRAG